MAYRVLIRRVRARLPSNPLLAAVAAFFVVHRDDLVQGARIVLFYVVLGTLVLGYHGFGISNAKNLRSSDVLGQIFASKYDRDSANAASANRRPAVVLVTDETLGAPVFRAEHSGWPPTFDFHAKVLQRILDEKPSALFIDILFRDENRGSPRRLRKVLRRYAKTCPPTPVLIAAGPTCPPEARDKRADLEKLVVKPFLGHALPVAVPLLAEEADHQVRQYPLWETSPDLPKDCPSAALAMYWLVAHRCLSARPIRPFDVAALRREIESDRDRDAFREPLEVIWGRRSSVHGEFSANDDVPSWRPSIAPDESFASIADAHTRCRVDMPGTWLCALFASAFGQDLRQTCPYGETIAAEDLLKSEPGARFRGRPVLYALSFAGAADTIVPPTHGMLPGVELHAMALDNLLTWNDNYIRRSDRRPIGPFTGPSTADMVLLAISGVLYALWRRVPAEERSRNLIAMLCLWVTPDCSQRTGDEPRSGSGGRGKDPPRWVVVTVDALVIRLVPPAVLLAAGWMLFVWFRQAPLDWVGHLAVFASVVGLMDLAAGGREVHDRPGAVLSPDSPTSSEKEDA